MKGRTIFGNFCRRKWYALSFVQTVRELRVLQETSSQECQLRKADRF